ncbi:glycosyltransferase [Algihabitans albus]|uniref:glycosyltransferase n=1 Tax=Algihabitans albus TaxID=2164067 RepID=UPI000E5CB447|nr:glycosyltransferase [Algihabitans albus]
MRVAIVAGDFPALSETFVLNHVLALLRAGVEVQVIAHRPRPDSLTHPEVAEHRLQDRTYYLDRPQGYAGRLLQLPRRLSRPRALRRARHWASACNAGKLGRAALGLDLLYSVTGDLPADPRFDVIHAHFGDGGVRAAYLRERGFLQGPLVTTLHGADDTYGPRPLRYLAERGDLNLPISNFWAEELMRLGFPEARVRVHHVGIDCGRYAFTPRLAGAGEPLRLVTVCRLAPRKGVQDALAALAEVRRQRPDFAFTFTIVGGGPMEAELRTLAGQLGLEREVRFLGAVDQSRVAEELSQAEVFLHPSYTTSSGEREGIPVSMMEAMARGLVVVSTQHAGIPELVEHGRSGWLVRERDVPALASAILRVASSREMIAAWGAAGRHRVETEFNRKDLDRQLLDIYRELSDGWSPDMTALPSKPLPAGRAALKLSTG